MSKKQKQRIDGIVSNQRGSQLRVASHQYAKSTEHKRIVIDPGFSFSVFAMIRKNKRTLFDRLY